MSVKYIDTFVVNGVKYGLEATDDGVRMWAGGGSIGTALSRTSAREQLHSYIRSRLRAERDSYQERADRANSALQSLEGDVFHLARFMQ